MTFKQSIKAINEASYDTHLTMAERSLYKWISTQNKHRHLFIQHLRKSWGTVFLKIDQKHKR
jgi:hypothetical protein